MTKRSGLKYLVLVLLVAAAVRLPTLAWRSFDSDEGATLYFSDLSYAELTQHLVDLSLERHPLLYYLLLKPWRQIVGDADLMIRLPSALAGMLTVAVVYQIGRRRLGEATAGLAAFLVALNPLVVFQHQEARMYATALLFTVVAVWALFEALDRPESRLGLKLGVFAVAMTLAAYSHLVAALLFPAMGLLLIWELRRTRRVAVWGLSALAVSAMAYSPYVINIFRTGNSGSGMTTLEDWWRSALGAATTLLDFQTTLSFPAHSVLLLGLLGVIVVVAIWRDWRQGIPFALWLGPVLAFSIFVTGRIGFFQTKIFTFSAVPLASLMALALFGKARRLPWHGALPALVILGFTLYGLSFQWRPGYPQEDYRHAAQFVQSQVTEDDTVILHLSWTHWVFSHYYPGQFVHPLPNNVDQSTPIEEVLSPFLDSTVVWLVQAGVGLAGSGGDPDRLVERWMAERYPIVTEVFPGGIDVRGYATRYRLTSVPQPATPVNITYPNGLTLVGYGLAQKEFPNRDLWLHPPSTWVPVTLYWSVEQPLSSDIRFSLVLEDEPGNVWGGEIPRERDVRAFYPPLAWRPGDVVRWDFDINANAQIPRGEYKIVLRVYELQNGAAIANDGNNDWLILDRVWLD